MFSKGQVPIQCREVRPGSLSPNQELPVGWLAASLQTPKKFVLVGNGKAEGEGQARQKVLWRGVHASSWDLWRRDKSVCGEPSLKELCEQIQNLALFPHASSHQGSHWPNLSGMGKEHSQGICAGPPPRTENRGEWAERPWGSPGKTPSAWGQISQREHLA